MPISIFQFILILQNFCVFLGKTWFIVFMLSLLAYWNWCMQWWLGCLMTHHFAGRRWSCQESTHHINYLEPLAIFLGFKSFFSNCTSCIDNLSIQIWRWCFEHNILISAKFFALWIEMQILCQENLLILVNILWKKMVIRENQ